MTTTHVPRVLFLCTGNACRSQMAEGWLRELAEGRVEALSAGTAPKGVNPGAVEAMAEVGVDLSGHRSESIEEYLAQPPDVVIAVCESAAERCPTIPGAAVLRWPFPDPDGAGDEVFREVRDSIRTKLAAWVERWGGGAVTRDALLAAASSH